MNVLILGVNLQNWVCDTLYKEQFALRKYLENNGSKVFFYGPGFDYWTNDVTEVVAKFKSNKIIIDILICYMNERQLLEDMPPEFVKQYSVPDRYRRFPVGIEKIEGIKKFLWINDFWHMTQADWSKAIIGNGFNNILATYCPPFLTQDVFNRFFPPEVRSYAKFYPCPRAIDPRVFYPRGGQKKYDVTLLGAMGAFYPDRSFFHKSLVNQSWLNYFTAPHPGYKFLNSSEALFGENYAKVISDSKIFVNCTSIYHLPFIKIYEVLASNTLLMCTKISGSNELGLIDGENFVEIDNRNFLEKIKYYIENEEELIKIAMSGYELFLKKHTPKHRAEQIYKIINGSPIKPIDKKRKTNSPIQIGYLKGVTNRIRFKLNKLISDSSRKKNIFEPIKDGSRLNWKYVVESKHILDAVGGMSLTDLKLIETYGLNFQIGDNIVITQHSEVVCYRPILLRDISEKKNATFMCEVGTSRGMQSIFWAKDLEKRGEKEGAIFTCDIDPSDVPTYKTPLTGENLFTREELWRLTGCSKYITFVHGDSAVLSNEIGKALSVRYLDIVYIDGGHTKENVLYDFQNLKRFFNEETIIICDDCDPRFPGVEEAANTIAEEMHFSIKLINFWPSHYKVAILTKSDFQL